MYCEVLGIIFIEKIFVFLYICNEVTNKLKNYWTNFKDSFAIKTCSGFIWTTFLPEWLKDGNDFGSHK